MEKTCTVCRVIKPLDQFARKATGRYGTQARCKPCQREYRKAYYDKDPEQARAKSRAYFQANREAVNARFGVHQRAKYAADPAFRAKQIASSRTSVLAVRLEVFTHYSDGPPHCACCGEQQDEFLTLDHTNGGGGQHRKEPGSKGSNGVLYWLRRNGYPEGYSVLCWNCHMAKDRRGGCPHQRE